MGSIEVEIMIKNDQTDKYAWKFKNNDYFGKSTQSLLLVHTFVSYGCGVGREMASGCKWGLLRTKKGPTSHPRIAHGQRYPLPCFIAVPRSWGESRAVASKYQCSVKTGVNLHTSIHTSICLLKRAWFQAQEVWFQASVVCSKAFCLKRKGLFSVRDDFRLKRLEFRPQWAGLELWAWGGGPTYGQIDAHMEIHLKFTSNQPPQALTLHLQSARDGLKDGQTN